MKKVSLTAAVLAALLLCLPAGAAEMESAIAESETDFTFDGSLPGDCSECTLGNLAADCAREESGADLCLLPSCYLTGTLESGSVFASDLDRVVPEDVELVTAEITDAELDELLEISVSRLTVNNAEQIVAEESAWGGYLQTSGFTWECDVSAPVGERVGYIRIDGTEIGAVDTFTIVTTAGLSEQFPEYLSLECTDIGLTLRGTMLSRITALGTLKKADTRVSVLGTSSYPLIQRFPIIAIVLACVLVALFASIPRIREREMFSFEGSRAKKGNQER